MGKKRILAAVMLLFAVVLAACGKQEDGMLTGIIFNRGHGSAWGNQLYIELCADEIAMLQYIPEGSMDLETAQHIPVTATQWQDIIAVVQGLPLEKEQPSLRERLFSISKLDGGLYRNLTLQWQTEKGVKQVQYKWPTDPRAQELEALLEALVQNVQREG